MSEYFVAVDIETTGLHARSNEILEISLLALDSELNELGPMFTRVVYMPAGEVEQWRSRSSEYVQNMHEENGLWAELPKGTPINIVQNEALEYLQKSIPELQYGEAKFVGNSLRLDMNFIEHHMPRLYEAMHYRSIDLTGIEKVLTMWGGFEAEPYDPSLVAHRSASDVRALMSQARSIKQYLKLTSPFA